MSADAKGGLLRRYAGIAGAAVGVLAAGAAASVLAERKAGARNRATAVVRIPQIHGRVLTVVADDDLRLYAEVDDADRDHRSTNAPILVFVHGYALNLDSWCLQRQALRGAHRMVYYDQRSHGRSTRSPKEHCTIDQLGRDLASVLDALDDDGPVILVGHSMGGMAVMALAYQRPEWFGSRVAGVALIATTSGGLEASTLGLPGMPGRLVHLVSPAVVAAMARAPRLVEGGRRFGSDFGIALTRRLAFGSTVPKEYVDFTDEMLAATPIGVVADFFPGFDDHEKPATLKTISQVPTVVIGGGRDAITPIAHTRRIAERVPSAELFELPEAGHMVILERHDEVTQALRRLVERVKESRSGRHLEDV